MAKKRRVPRAPAAQQDNAGRVPQILLLARCTDWAKKSFQSFFNPRNPGRNPLPGWKEWADSGGD